MRSVGVGFDDVRDAGRTDTGGAFAGLGVPSVTMSIACAIEGMFRKKGFGSQFHMPVVRRTKELLARRSE